MDLEKILKAYAETVETIIPRSPILPQLLCLVNFWGLKKIPVYDFHGILAPSNEHLPA